MLKDFTLSLLAIFEIPHNESWWNMQWLGEAPIRLSNFAELAVYQPNLCPWAWAVEWDKTIMP